MVARVGFGVERFEGGQEARGDAVLLVEGEGFLQAGFRDEVAVC